MLRIQAPQPVVFIYRQAGAHRQRFITSPKAFGAKKSSRKAARHAGNTSGTSFSGQTREIALSHIRFDSLVPFTFGIVIEPLRESANIALWQSLDGFLDFLDRAHERDLGRLRVDRQAPAKS